MLWFNSHLLKQNSGIAWSNGGWGGVLVVVDLLPGVDDSGASIPSGSMEA